ncbi:MAG: hypothetical protein A2Z16_07350 [Chloroflexi bacterium RBG_16_54_18]|nr:MAG: hypothetical protein A2Z16_07350 [Chloroflexi bacterium RBG_16_54_18]
MAVILSPDLLDRLLEHDAWTTRRVLELAGPLDDVQLDQDFDIGHGTFRETARHMLGNIQTWTDLMTGQGARRELPVKLYLIELQERFAAAYRDFARVARSARDEGRLSESFADTLDVPPREKSFAGTILHVLTHDHMHRSELLHMLDRLGVQDLIEGDVLSWEASRK